MVGLPCALGAFAPAAVAVVAWQEVQGAPAARVARVVVPELVSLAGWCEAEKLLAARLAAYEAVLQWDSDHADARRILGWKRGKDGEWVRARPAREARDRTGLEGELAQRRGAVVDLALAECERWVAAGGDARALAEVHARLLAAAPDHAGLRAALGHLPLPEGGWAPADVARALAAEAARQEVVDQLRAARTAPERVEATALDEPAQRALRWAGVARAAGALVADTVSFAEAEAIAAAVDVTPDVARWLVPVTATFADAGGQHPPGDDGAGHPAWWSQPRFYVTQSSADRDALVRALGAELDDQRKALLRRVNTGFLDKRCSIGVWAPSPLERLEAAVRQRVGLYFQRSFGIGPENGWVWEGVGLLISGSIVGTKQLVYVRLQPTDQTTAKGGGKRDDKLFGPNADWLALARDLMASPRAPKLGLLVGKDVNKMDREDLLAAFALASWLVDGWPEVAPVVLARVGAGHPPVSALEEELGLTLPDVERRLRAWLEGVRPRAR